MDVSVQHSESTEAAQQTVTEEAQLYSSHTQHLSFRISVTATFPRRQIILLNALSPCEYFPGQRGLLLMNGLPAASFSLACSQSVVFEEIASARLSRRGEKYLCIFLTSRLFIPHNLLFVSKCVRSHPGSAEPVWPYCANICESCDQNGHVSDLFGFKRSYFFYMWYRQASHGS